jgi:hypothetical protein
MVRTSRLAARLLASADTKQLDKVYWINIHIVWRGQSHHFKTIRLFLGAAIDEKTATQKPKKVKISATPSQFSSYISQTTKTRRLRFSPIDLANNSTHNRSISYFLGPQVTISEKSKPP